MRRLSDSSMTPPPGISSNLYLAADAITGINGHATHSPVLGTVTFSGDRSFRPSHWDLMALLPVKALHTCSLGGTVIGLPILY